MITIILFIILWLIFAFEINIEYEKGTVTLWYTSFYGKRKYFIIWRTH